MRDKRIAFSDHFLERAEERALGKNFYGVISAAAGALRNEMVEALTKATIRAAELKTDRFILKTGNRRYTVEMNDGKPRIATEVVICDHKVVLGLSDVDAKPVAVTVTPAETKIKRQLKERRAARKEKVWN